MLNFLLSSTSATDAASQAASNPNSLMSLASAILPIAVLFAIMYFFMIRPQQKAQKEEQKMRSNIQVGDEIVTIGGIYGKVMALKDDSLIIETGPDRDKMRVARWSVQQNLTIHDEQK